MICEEVSRHPSQVHETIYTQPNEPEDDSIDRPIAGGISEVGFGVTPYKRIKDHQRHNNSNNIMNLFEAVGRYLFGDKYAVGEYAVAWVVDSTFAVLSEAVVSLGLWW